MPWVTLLYLTANLLLGMHLYHGAYSLLQSLGFNHPALQRDGSPAARARCYLVDRRQRRHAAQRALRTSFTDARTRIDQFSSFGPERSGSLGSNREALERTPLPQQAGQPGQPAASTQVIVVGSGLAGGAAAATLGELGYNVTCFCYQDSPRRAHSIAAQGGINAAKNYQNDGDSVYRLFYDTVKGGDFRARESNVYRLAELSVNIIDQCVAQGVPFAREYGGLLANRSFGGAQVSRTFYARGQTGQQLLLGAYQALERQIDAGTVKMYPRTEMLDADRRSTARRAASSRATW